MIQIEDIILRHSRRGMELLRGALSPDFCRQAASEVLSWPRGTVLLATGFYVSGHAETDGPAGTLALARVLERLGFRPVVVTDSFCRGFFEPEGIPVYYLPLDACEDDCKRILRDLRPVGMISVERCGENIEGDYTNMEGESIRAHTAPVDRMFELAKGSVPTIGVGDGGNEIGMGNLRDVIREKLSLIPCRVETDYLILATVSNWGAYGLGAALSKEAGEDLLPSFEAIRNFLIQTVSLGSVDGISGRSVLRVDGFDLGTEEEILEDLRRAAGRGQKR